MEGCFIPRCAQPCADDDAADGTTEAAEFNQTLDASPTVKSKLPLKLLSRWSGSTGEHVAAEDEDDNAAEMSPRSPSVFRKVNCEGTSVEPELINQTIEYLWADISKFAVTVLRRSVEPAVQKALGTLGKKFAFKLDECNLGDQAVKFGAVDSVRIQEHVPSGVMKSIVWTSKVEWDGNLNILTTFSGIRMGITAMTLKGVLVMQASGMIPQPPFFSGVHAFFINPPEIDIKFKGKIRQLIEGSELVKAKILEVAYAKIGSLIVVPNSIGALLDKSADYFEVMRPSPKGLLELCVHRAEHLPAMDNGFLGKKSSDPYVVLNCGAQRLKSEVKTKTLNPTFNFTSWLRIFSPLHQEVQVGLWDEDFGKTDDFLGAAKLPVSWLITNKAGVEEFKAPLVGGCAGEDACAWLSVKWHPLQAGCGSSASKHPQLQNIDTVLLCGIYEIDKLPWESEGTEYWVCVRCSRDLRKDHVEVTRRVQRLSRVCDEAEVLAMQRKIEQLLPFNVPSDVMADCFDLPCGPFREKVLSKTTQSVELDELRKLEAGRCGKLEINHSCPAFLLDAPDEAVLRFEVKCQAPGGRERHVGTCTFNVKELRQEKLGKAVRTLCCQDTKIYLKAKMETYNFCERQDGQLKPHLSDVYANMKNYAT
mmetsp:Transcript_20048/g.36215  ORF Transcript_20048/g.36215 Transcript_20048/m.36215 type:complete len:647 (-) Transcript_20048:32-1972(-)